MYYRIYNNQLNQSSNLFITETFHVQDILVLLHADAIFFMCQFMRGSSFNECSFELQISNKSLPVDCCVKKSNKDLQITFCNITNLTGKYNVTVYEPAAASSHGTRIPILFVSIAACLYSYGFFLPWLYVYI